MGGPLSSGKVTDQVAAAAIMPERPLMTVRRTPLRGYTKTAPRG